MSDTETEKTRNPILWICGLGAVWSSVGVARLWGSEDIGVISWLRWEREVEGNLCCRAPSFPTFQPTTPADESQIANSAGIIFSHSVRCWLSHFFDIYYIFLKTFVYHILFSFFIFCHILEESLLFDYFQAAPCPGWAASAGRRDSPGFRCRRLNSLSMNTITQKLSQNDTFSPQVEELEKSLSRAVGASQQKQQQLDSLNQGLEKIKRKVSKVFCICRLSKGLI